MTTEQHDLAPPSHRLSMWFLYDVIMATIGILIVVVGRGGPFWMMFLGMCAIQSIFLAKLSQLAGTLMLRESGYPWGKLLLYSVLGPALLVFMPTIFVAGLGGAIAGVCCVAALFVSVFFLMPPYFIFQMNNLEVRVVNGITEIKSPRGQFSLQHLFVWSTVCSLVFGLLGLWRNVDAPYRSDSYLTIMYFIFLWVMPYVWWQAWLSPECRWMSHTLFATVLLVFGPFVACPRFEEQGIMFAYLVTLAGAINVHLWSMRRSGL